MKGRYRSITPVTDFSITQKIRTQLIEDGHTDLAVESITKPISELEEAHGYLKERVKALELEKAGWVTESGVHRILAAKAGKVAIDWAYWVVRGTLSAAALALAGWIGRLAWKGLHV